MFEFQHKTLYSFDIDVALKGRGLDFDYRNLWQTEYKSFERGSLVLFNEDKFQTRWEQHNPMINWYNLKNNYELKQVKDFNSGWILYRIE